MIVLICCEFRVRNVIIMWLTKPSELCSIQSHWNNELQNVWLSFVNFQKKIAKPWQQIGEFLCDWPFPYTKRLYMKNDQTNLLLFRWCRAEKNTISCDGHEWWSRQPLAHTCRGRLIAGGPTSPQDRWSLKRWYKNNHNTTLPSAKHLDDDETFADIFNELAVLADTSAAVAHAFKHCNLRRPSSKKSSRVIYNYIR